MIWYGLIWYIMGHNTQTQWLSGVQDKSTKTIAEGTKTCDPRTSPFSLVELPLSIIFLWFFYAFPMVSFGGTTYLLFLSRADPSIRTWFLWGTACSTAPELSVSYYGWKEILHLGWLKQDETLEIMGCLPPINWCRISKLRVFETHNPQESWRNYASVFLKSIQGFSALIISQRFGHHNTIFGEKSMGKPMGKWNKSIYQFWVFHINS